MLALNTKKSWILVVIAAVLMLAVTGCNNSPGHGEPYLLKVGAGDEEIIATSYDFKRFWDAYSAPIYANGDVNAFFTQMGIEQVRIKVFSSPFLIIKLIKTKADIRTFFIEAGLKQTKREAFDQFVIAMLIEARAADLGIFISNEELEAEITKIKDEYSEAVFNETLLKTAMPKDLWSEGLRRRMLQETIMRLDLYAHGGITPEDVEEYGGLRNGRTKATAEEVLERVYRAKAENDFVNWIKKLQEYYPVEINREELASVLSEP